MDGGHTADPRQFTMDREVAREKLSDFQLPDPHFYVLLLIRAAMIRGASHVDIRTDTRGVQIRFNGSPFSRLDLEELYDAAMSGKTDPRTRALGALALGLRTVSSLEGFGSLDMVTGDDRSSTRLRLEPGWGELLEDALPGVRGTAVAIRFRGRDEAVAPEVAVIEERCGYAGGEIYLDGRDVTQGLRLRLDEAVVTTTIEQDGVRGAAGFLPEGEHTAELRLVRDGVLLATHELDVADDRFVAVVETDGLELDLSQFDVIQDEAYARLVQIIQRTYAASARDEDVEASCGEWLDKQALIRLDHLAHFHSSRYTATFSVFMLISAGLVGPPLILYLVQGSERASWVGPLAIGMAALCAVTWLTSIPRRLFVDTPTFERASGLLPVGGRLRPMAEQHAKGRGGAIARILR